MSPFQFSILIHYYVSPAPHEGQVSVDALDEVIDHFIGAGMLVIRDEHDREYGAKYKTTEKARFWIEYVLSTPYPEVAWKIPVREPRE